MFVTIFLDSYENPRRKKFLNPSYLKHLEVIERNSDILFYFYTSLQSLKKVL